MPDCIECNKYKHYKDRNCSGGVSPSPLIRDKNVRFVIDKNTVLNFCPKLLILNKVVNELLTLYNLYEKGIMYNDGAYLNQPYWYIRAMRYLDSVKAEYEKEQLSSMNKGV